MDEYFESRNGNHGPKQPGGPSDKTRSWVNSQASDPPDLPPGEGTILDGEKPSSVALFGENVGGEGRGEERRRPSKKDSYRRRSKHVTSPDPEERRSSRRKESRRTTAEREDVGGGGGVRSGSGSGGDGGVYTSKHRSSRRREMEYDAYADGGPAAGGMRTFDGRPAVANKRNSILGRWGGFL
ncbi:hypothetical protein EPUS_01390 [Endocarpon pusillum Z07020]|uniref:Uncharacterized protein n=1 Tax=Endocarpon pusillum (strain Z07020 / HMAS-L-300199) TaxID=1263415 RepID=U1GEK1_ENDPU|nr:uncharacterized protein EPUS_01390 [Endocarpon pusillum Z07020]ERF76057.1 hypothetical protein EPUS_01390 [Endocarpon pusillum Z07020]